MPPHRIQLSGIKYNNLVTVYKSEGASDDEVLRMISVATLLAARDAGITGEIEAFVASKKEKEECEA